MPNKNGADREALRSVAERVLDHIFTACSSEQWAELLRIPLEHAASDGDAGLAQKVVAAGAKMGRALHEAVQGGHKEIVTNVLDNGAPIN